MYLVSVSDFNEIPNIDELDSKVSDQLDALIDERVQLLLLNVLGYAEFKELNSFIEEGVLISTAPQKWIDFVEGAEYTYFEKLQKWQGVKKMLVNYVYYYWLYKSASFLSGIGEVRGEANASINVNPTQRLVNYWNDFVIVNKELMQYLSIAIPNLDSKEYNFMNQLGI